MPSANVLSRGSEAAVGSSDISKVDADWLMSLMSKMMSVNLHDVVVVVL